jgi:hypothetical protein
MCLAYFLKNWIVHNETVWDTHNKHVPVCKYEAMNRENKTNLLAYTCFLCGRTVIWWVCVQQLVLTVHFGSSTYSLVFKGVTAIWLIVLIPNRGFDSRRVIWIFNWLIPSNRNTARGSTEPLAEISTRNISWGKGGRCLGLTTCHLHVPIV